MMDKEVPPPVTNIPPDATAGQPNQKKPLPAFTPIPLVKTMVFPDGVAKPRHIPAPPQVFEDGIDITANGYNAKVLHFQGVPGEKVDEAPHPTVTIKSVHSLSDEKEDPTFDPNAPRLDINGRVLNLEGAEGEEENTGPTKYVKVRPIRSLSDMQKDAQQNGLISKNLLDINAKVQAPIATPDPGGKKQTDPFALQKAIRTFKSDVAETAQGMSVAEIAIAQDSEASQVARLGTKNFVRPQERHTVRNIAYFFLSIILIGGGGYAGYYFYSNSTLPHITYDQQIPQSRNVAGLLKADTQQIIPSDGLTNDSFAALIVDKRKEPSTLADGQIEELVFSTLKTGYESRLPVATLFDLFGSRAPSLLYRSFEPEYMFGYIQHGSTKSPFMIFKTRQFQSTFAGMLAWEKTMGQDMVATFEVNTPMITTPVTTTPIVPVVVIAGTSTATTSSAITTSASSTSSTTPVIATTTPPQTLVERVVQNPDLFIPITNSKDKVLRNKDARILSRIQGGEIIAYAFSDKDTLIITSGEVPLEILIEKLDNQIYTR